MDLRELKVEKPEKVEEWWPSIERHLYKLPQNYHLLQRQRAPVWQIVFMVLFPVLFGSVLFLTALIIIQSQTLCSAGALSAGGVQRTQVCPM